MNVSFEALRSMSCSWFNGSAGKMLLRTLGVQRFESEILVDMEFSCKTDISGISDTMFVLEIETA